MPTLISILITLSAAAIMVHQLMRPNHERPWRKIAALICVLLASMFLFGLYVLHPRTHPAVVIVYVGCMLLLVLSLFVIALRDLVHTRKTLRDMRLRRWKAALTELNGSGDSEGDSTS